MKTYICGNMVNINSKLTRFKFNEINIHGAISISKSTVIFIEPGCDKIDPYVAHLIRTKFSFDHAAAATQHTLLLRIGIHASKRPPREPFNKIKCLTAGVFVLLHSMFTL